MKQLIAFALLIAVPFLGFSQEQVTTQEKTTPSHENWREGFWDMSHEERGALLQDPNIDPNEVLNFIKANRDHFDVPLKMGGGDAAIFGCSFWYEHDLIAANELSDNNWELFQGGCGAGQGVDAFWGQVNIDFDFCFYGQTYNHFYINTKGTLSFGEPMCDWTPDPFPAANNFNQIAALWADFDFTVSGLCMWEVTPTAAIVSFINVGYWPGQGGLTNTMQMVITDGNDPILPAGYNVGFFYGDMGWCHGGVGGIGGCCGPNPGIVGMDRANTTDGLQIGQFNELNGFWNGPYEDSGVHWLDYKNFFLAACNETGDGGLVNHPPIPTNNNAMFNGVWPSAACDTIRVCLNDTVDLFASYLAPEADQIVSMNIDDSNAPLLLIQQADDGVQALFHGLLVGADPYIGMHTLTITATDNGEPAASVTQTFVIEVLNQAAPDITVSGDAAICASQFANWTVEPAGLDYYIWSNGAAGPTATSVDIGYGGEFWVQAFSNGCMSQEYFDIVETTYIIPPLSYNPSNFACSGNPVEVCFINEYPGGAWFTCYDDPQFDCVSPGNWDGPCALLEPGIYVAHALDAEGCEGLDTFVIFSQEAFIPEMVFEPFCDDMSPAVFEGGFANPGEGNLTIWWTDPEGAFANGSYLTITINEGLASQEEYFFAMLNNGSFDWNISDQQIPVGYGDTITVNFVQANNDDQNNTVQIYNCGDNIAVYDGTPTANGLLWEGVASCTSEPALGVWTQDNCPCDGTFSNPDQFNGTFTPCAPGVYNLTFEESTCNVQHNFVLEYTDVPSNVSLSPSTSQTLCSGETINFTGTYNVPTDCGLNVTWSAATPSATDNSLATYSNNAPGNCNTETVVFEVSNGCGTDQFQVQVSSFESIAANLNDEVLCDGGTFVLAPVQNDSPCLQYDWSNGSTDPSITVSSTGLYEVTVSNDCENVTVSANINVAAGYTAPGPYNVVECDENFYTLDAGNVFSGYTWFWGSDPNLNQNEQTFTINGNGSYTVLLQVTDDLGCDTYVTEYNVAIDDYPVLNPVPNVNDTIYICPLEIEVLNMGYSDGNFYTWYLECPGEPLLIDSNSDNLELGSDMFPIDCLNEFITVTATADNICPGDATVSWIVQASLCPISAPNVFTPNEDNQGNDRFIIDGIEVYNNTELFVYDRWGHLVYENLNYENSWRAPDLADGTYFYVARMLDSQGKLVRDIESSLTILR